MSYNKLIYNRAEGEISMRHFNAENQRDIRLRKISAEIPEIIEVNHRLTQTVVQLSKLIISKSDNFEKRFEDIRNANLQAQKLEAELLSSHGYPADYLKIKYTCEKCSDKGYINGIRCECLTNLLRKYSIDQLNESANMPQCDFEHFSLDYYRDKKAPNGSDCYEKMAGILDYCIDYAKSFKLTSENVLMYGKTGVGKTHLSLSIAKRVAENGFTVAYGSLINYLTLIEKEHFGKAGNEENDTMNLLISTELLVLDDLGSEFNTPFYESAIYNIINSRINLGLPTIISTNFTVAELQNKYNDRIISRILGGYTMLYFVGEDIRQLKRISGNN